MTPKACSAAPLDFRILLSKFRPLASFYVTKPLSFGYFQVESELYWCAEYFTPRSLNLLQVSTPQD